MPKSARFLVLALLAHALPLFGQSTFLVWTNGGHVPPFDTWEKAATNLQSAVDAAAAGDLVIVTNGLYTSGSNTINLVTVRVPLTLRGVGADRVALSGGGSRRVLLATSTGVVVEGVAIINGYRPTLEYGAGLLLTNGAVRHCVISNNVQNGRQVKGAGIFMVGGVLEDCDLHANRAEGSDGSSLGSAVYADAGALIQRCRITANRGSASLSATAGAVYLVANCLVRNCFVANNSASGYMNPAPGAGTLTAGIYSAGAGNRVEYCTITGNVIQNGNGAGLYLYRGHGLNNIVYFNHAEFRGRYRSEHDNAFVTPNRADTSLSNSCIHPLVPGGGNISADPLLADWPNGDFSLLPGSPCLDAAAATPAITTDYGATERGADGDGDGNAGPDMGALEASAASGGPFRCGFRTLGGEAVGAASVSFAAQAAGPDTNGVIFTWDFDGDGSDDATGQAPSRVFEPGAYAVRLTASNGTASALLIRSNDVRIAPLLLHVAPNGAHVFPFTSPATAATTLQAAVDAALETAAATSQVHVGDGLYRLTRPLTLDKGVELRSLNGPSAVILHAQGVSGRRVLELFGGASKAVVDGFTLTGGSLPTLQNGAGVYMLAGTVIHATITNNLTSGRNAVAGGVRMLDGLLEDCTVSDNIALGGDGSGSACRGAGVVASGGLINRCRIQRNRLTATTGGALGGGVHLSGTALLRNSLITGNFASNSPALHLGAGVYVESTNNRVENCTIADNYIATGTNAGVYLYRGALVNTIVWRNYLKGFEDSLPNHMNVITNAGSLSWCDTYPPAPGPLNIAADPLFADRPAGDYRLRPDSPCANTGTNLDWTAAGTDLAGQPRRRHGTVEMGCYEIQPPRGTMLLMR